jgi:tetratricopeptide (TPR) repeat protein
LKARAYRAAIDAAARQDPLLNFYLNAPWFILEGEGEQSQELAIGRWRHLQGRFDSEDDDAILGAKKLYLNQRQPEFEIADLRGNVELQMRYGIRRELRVTPEQYDMQIQQIQLLMRQGKVLASFWLSLIQYDTGRFDLARNWFRQRVLEDGVDSPWEAPARYNLARALERLGETEQAGEILRTEGDPQEHGNRIRARMILRGLPRGDSDVDAD